MNKNPKGMDPKDPLSKQIGGQHYKGCAIQPVEYIHANHMGFIEGCVVKYVTRWQDRGGLEDLRKAIHFLEMLIELELRKQDKMESNEVEPREDEDER